VAGRVSGKAAIVTGGARGIGAEYAVALGREGASICVADVADPGPVRQRLEAEGVKAISATVDVTVRSSVEAMIAATERAFGRVDILVNNAAIFAGLALTPFEEIASEEWDRVNAVNVRGVFECCRAAVPAMRLQGGGRIVNIASATVFKGAPMLLHYVASKGAVIALTRALAREVGKDGIGVNCIAPGFTLSDGVRENGDYDEAFRAANAATRAIPRDAVPADMLGALVFLCSAESEFVTGQTIVVDGGSVMH
jgi:NAD(P)-dependent dehydrogenase (short-subunit alcohol dehydrogenase family)